MALVERFEDLFCWQAARKLVEMVYSSCEDGRLSKDFETRGQFKRAALSSMNNIAEGFGRSSAKESIRYLEIAQGSATEVKSITYALFDMKYLTEEKVMEIREQAERTKSLTIGFMRYLKNRNPVEKIKPSTQTR